MTKYIYLAGPIAGCNKTQANNWRTDIQNRFAEFSDNLIGISPLRCEPLVGRKYKLNEKDVRFGTHSAISGKNWWDTTTCDLILAYLPKELNELRPSYGTMIEIGWAIGLRKPIILVSDDKYLKGHPLISRNVDWIVDNFDDAYDIIIGLFGDYV